MSFNFPGWYFIGRFPDEEDGVGSWLLHNGRQAAWLECPPGSDPRAALRALGLSSCRYALVSHHHEDHCDNPRTVQRFPHFVTLEFELGGEPLYIVSAPKHSNTDIIVVFRGVAMTGDIELGTLDSVNQEVSKATKRKSMAYYRGFQQRTGYHVHTIISAHLNDYRTGVNWDELF